MPRELAIRIAQRLQSGDLLALKSQRPSERDVQNEGRDTQEDDRNQKPKRLQLSELVFERPLRDLQRSRDSTTPAIRLDETIEDRDRVIDRCPPCEVERHVVETALHLERRRQGTPAHPEDSEL